MHLTDILAAAVAALLTGMGMGSGGVLVIYLTLWAEIEQYTAQGINLLFFLVSGGAALAVHITKRRLYPGVILLTTLFGIGGSLLGAYLAGRLPPSLLRRSFGGMLVISGLAGWIRTVKAPKKPSPSRHSSFR